MTFETLKKYKDMFIEQYDYSHQSDKMVWFHGVQLKEISGISFHFADSVIFEYSEDTLNILIYQESTSNPIEIKNLV